MSPNSPRSEGFEHIETAVVVQAWQSRFGVDEASFLGCAFYKRAQNIWAFSDAILPRLSYETLGMRMMSLKEKPWKPTTCALQVFGRHATRNVISLDSNQARLFMAGESLDLKSDAEDGYVIAIYDDQVLGCGLYSRGRLISQIPKERRIDEDTEGDL